MQILNIKIPLSAVLWKLIVDATVILNDNTRISQNCIKSLPMLLFNLFQNTSRTTYEGNTFKEMAVI